MLRAYDEDQRHCIVGCGPVRRMEDRIRELCKALLREKDPEKWRPLIVQLRLELHAYVEGIRRRASGYPVMRERRASEALDPDDPSLIPHN